jgi:hypothetical protein
MLLERGAGLAVEAVQAIRKMRGGAQSQLMLGADRQLWVVKFQNNPQHIRVLANELIVTRLAAAIGLPVPDCDVIDVSPWLVENTPDLFFEVGGSRRDRYLPGLQFGSRFIGAQAELQPAGRRRGSSPLIIGQTVDYLPEPQLEEVRNLADFAGMLCLDKWTCNCNGRQAVFFRGAREPRYTATFIDHGFCFNAGSWNFADSPLRGVYGSNRVYDGVSGWQSFEPWLSRIEGMSPEKIWEIADVVPPEWYGGDGGAIERLIEQLLSRRGRVRELIQSFRDSGREPFPLWSTTKTVVVPRLFAEPVAEPGSGGYVM